MDKETDPERVVAIIPARGGSKGIPLKNIRTLCGHPLIYYIIKASLGARKVGHTVVSTDSEDIAKVSFACGAQTIKRPPEIATDISTSEEAVLHALDDLRSQGKTFDIALLLQPTSPLTRSSTIDSLVQKVEDGFDSSCCDSQLKVFLLDDPDLMQRPMRQSHSPKVRETGNGWAFRVESFRETGNRTCGKQGTVRVSSYEATEIDDPEDLLIAEALLRKDVRRSEGLYFSKRDGPSDFESYWGKVIDPDGVERDLASEVEGRTKDLSGELSYINSLPGGRICDVGCGMGSMLLGTDESKWEKHGVEISSVAARVASDFGKVFHGELSAAQYPSGHFDAVVCHHVVEHVPDPYSLIGEINRIMKVGGKLVMATPDFDGGCARLFGDKYRLLHDKTHINLFSLASLTMFVEDHGFEVEEREFPFFDTKYFTEENLLRMFDTRSVSPPFHGNFITLYCAKK